jgi:hypothetical protein
LVCIFPSLDRLARPQSGLSCDQSKLPPANTIIESVTPVPAAGQQPNIVLHNTGGQLANITGWKLLLSEDSAAAQDELYIADNERCRPNGTLPAGGSLVFTPKSDTNPCGFPFGLSARCVRACPEFAHPVQGLSKEWPESQGWHAFSAFCTVIIIIIMLQGPLQTQ